ncbi:MAG: 2-isopropylmalate synthase, partial [Proteobacteria bacterium]|nr:2-isopropylmalate synthase [Pseudomonadota bacterium]
MKDEPDVKVFDTTLRDGEQMPQLALGQSAKLAIAKKLDELGVSVIEAGFPVNSAEEAESVRRIAHEVSAVVCGIGRPVKADLEAIVGTGAAMADVFCSTSDLQMAQSAFKTREQVLAASVDAVRFVKDAGLTCMFTPMDATRTDPGFLIEVCGAARDAGADWIGLTDTVGVGTPASVAELVTRVKAAVKAPVSIHCHDDFGLATANTVAAVLAGAGMVQVCVNGLGERAGNAALEEVAAALKCLYGRDCGLDMTKLYSTSRLVERLSGVGVPPNKAVIGANAFAHESGIHAAGVMRDGRTFEPGLMTPDMVGHRRRLVVGKHTGRHGIAQVLTEAGLEPNAEELAEIVARVRSVVAKGKPLTNTDLFAIAETVMQKVPADLRAIVLE